MEALESLFYILTVSSDTSSMADGNLFPMSLFGNF
jgi:hypothetical protein